MEERILKILAEINEEIPDYEGDNMFDDGLIDSFMVMDIINEIEDEFDIEIDAKYVLEENFKTKEAIFNLIESIINE